MNNQLTICWYEWIRFKLNIVCNARSVILQFTALLWVVCHFQTPCVCAAVVCANVPCFPSISILYFRGIVFSSRPIKSKRLVMLVAVLKSTFKVTWINERDLELGTCSWVGELLYKRRELVQDAIQSILNAYFQSITYKSTLLVHFFLCHNYFFVLFTEANYYSVPCDVTESFFCLLVLLFK